MGLLRAPALAFGPGQPAAAALERTFGDKQIIGWAFDAFLTEEIIMLEFAPWRGRAQFIWYAAQGEIGAGVAWSIGGSLAAVDRLQAHSAIHVSDWVRVDWKGGILPVHREAPHIGDTLLRDAVLLTVNLEGSVI